MHQLSTQNVRLSHYQPDTDSTFAARLQAHSIPSLTRRVHDFPPSSRNANHYLLYFHHHSPLPDHSPLMSSAAQSGPRSGRGGSRGQARGRGRGAPRGRRANFGGSLTNNASSSTRAAAADSNPNNHTQAEHDHDHDQDHQHDNQAQQPASNDNDELPPEVELCFICAEPVKLYSVAPCEHRTCHICAIRLRALYKKTDCTFCKVSLLLLLLLAHSH